jgi:uncharacterized SAM-binding protein YcdF (DUF218 family)
LEWLITNAIVALLVPPGCLLLLAAAAALATRRHPRIGRALMGLSLVALYALSTPFAAGWLLRALESTPGTPLSDTSSQAIVVLGGGTYPAAPEYGGDTVSPASLVRLRYAARLHRATNKPVLVSGGDPRGNTSSEATQMKAVLEQEFGVSVKWAESNSNNTLENARLSYRLLEPGGIRRIYLVTHAWHMPRAQFAFERAGFTVIPAPTAHASRRELRILDFLPDAGALRDSSLFFHEVIGIGWYHLRFSLSRP